MQKWLRQNSDDLSTSEQILGFLERSQQAKLFCFDNGSFAQRMFRSRNIKPTSQVNSITLGQNISNDLDALAPASAACSKVVNVKHVLAYATLQ